MSDYTPAEEAIADAFADAYPTQDNLDEVTRRAIEAVRAEEREKAAQIAEELEGLADSLDEHVSRDEVYGALMALSAQIREQGKEQGS